VDDYAQAKPLRLRMYVLCSECARLIDIAEGNRQQRYVEGETLSGMFARLLVENAGHKRMKTNPLPIIALGILLGAILIYFAF
jgi:hypothetical protein